MKVTKVDRTRIAVGKTGASRTVSGLLYRNPNNGSNLETMEDQIAERIRKANFLYSVFFRRKETDSETRKFQAEFSALIKDMVKVRGVEAAYKSEKQERIDEAIGNQIKFLLEKESISYKLRRDQITKRMSEIAYNYRTEDAFQDALDQNFLSMRKSLKRGTNHWVAAKLMTGFANRNHLTLKKVVEDLDATKHEELVKFIDAVNRDYYKTAILKSIRRINVKVQPRKDILSLTSAANEKHKGLNDTLNDYASSPARADETLLSIKKILFAYFLPDDSKAEADFLKPENLWNIPRRDETFFDSFFPSEEPVNSSKNGSNTELYVLFDKDKIDDKAVKKRINYVNYGTFLARKAEASSDRDEYWISYIKEYVEKHYVESKRGLKRQECFATAMMLECWKEIIRFLCGKYIDLGKAVYHFAMPDDMTLLSNQQADRTYVYGEIRDEYKDGISSFTYESIKAEENLQRDISVATVAATAALSRSVVDDKKRNDYAKKLRSEQQKAEQEDILFLSEQDLREVKKDNTAKLLLRFYGGASSVPEMAGADDFEFAKEIASHLKSVRNENFHYTAGRRDEVSLTYTDLLYQNDVRAYGNLIRQKYYSNNVAMFYEEREISSLVERLYANDEVKEAQIPAFKTIFKRKELPEYIGNHVKSPQNMTDKDKTIYDGALYFLLKEIYYRDFLVSGEIGSYFFQAVENHKREMENQGAQLKNAAASFSDYVEVLKVRFDSGELSFGAVCQFITQEYNQQNQKKDEPAVYQHFKLLFSLCLKKAFVQYIAGNKERYQFLKQPQVRTISGEQHYLEKVEIGCYRDSKLSQETAVWYTFAHFLHPRQLNLLIGDFKNYIQFKQDIFRRTGYAGQLKESEKQKEKEKLDLAIQRVTDILDVLEFVRGVAGRISGTFEDYYDSREDYAAYLKNYINFGNADPNSEYNSLTSFCLNTLDQGAVIDLYVDERNPKLLRNVEIARMYAGGDISLNKDGNRNLYKQIQPDEIKTFYRTKDEAEKILAGGLCHNPKEQEQVVKMQRLKNRIMLNEVTDLFSLVNDLLGKLVSLSYLRERDEMYLLLGFYYMALKQEAAWKETFDTLSHAKYQVDGGFVLYQVCAMFDFGCKLVYQDGDKWENIGGQTSGKVLKFYKGHKTSMEKALRLFEIGKYEEQVTELRNYVDHSKYYSDSRFSLMDLYSGYYTKCFNYSTRLRKSVAYNFSNILEKNFIDTENLVRFEKMDDTVKMKLNGKLKSQKFTYKLKEEHKDEKQNGKQKNDRNSFSGHQKFRDSKVENRREAKLDAKSETFLEGVKGILEYRQEQQ